MNTNGFEKVEFNFNCNFDLDDEDASNDSDPLALVHDSSFNSNKDNEVVKMVVSSACASVPVSVNKTQHQNQPQCMKRAASPPPPHMQSSPKKRLVTVIPKPRPRLHNLAIIQPQTDTTITTTQAPTIVKKIQPTSLSSSVSTNTPSTPLNPIFLQSKLPSESQSNNTSHVKKIIVAVKSPMQIHTNNNKNNNNNNSNSVVSTSESGIQIPIIKSVISLQQPNVEKTVRTLVQPKTMITTNTATTTNTTRLIVQPKQLNNFVSNPRISLTSLLAGSRKVIPQTGIPRFILSTSGLGRPPGPGPSSMLTNTNVSLSKSRSVQKINVANNNNCVDKPTDNNKSNVEPTNSWKYFKCEHCDKSFWQEILLTEHMKKHNPNKPYKCIECDRSYHSKKLLLLHSESHAGLKTFGCHLCSQTFRRQASLDLHLNGHEGIFPFACAICDKSFRKSGSLRIHQLTTHQVVLPINAKDDAEDEDSP